MRSHWRLCRLTDAACPLHSRWRLCRLTDMACPLRVCGYNLSLLMVRCSNDTDGFPRRFHRLAMTRHMCAVLLSSPAKGRGTAKRWRGSLSFNTIFQFCELENTSLIHYSLMKSPVTACAAPPPLARGTREKRFILARGTEDEAFLDNSISLSQGGKGTVPYEMTVLCKLRILRQPLH